MPSSFLIFTGRSNVAMGYKLQSVGEQQLIAHVTVEFALYNGLNNIYTADSNYTIQVC